MAPKTVRWCDAMDADPEFQSTRVLINVCAMSREGVYDDNRKVFFMAARWRKKNILEKCPKSISVGWKWVGVRQTDRQRGREAGRVRERERERERGQREIMCVCV